MARTLRLSLAAVFIALSLQAAFWSQTRGIRAAGEAVPPAPSILAATVLAMGDNQFFYRTQTFALQNSGDEGRRITPLNEYDYQRLGQWFSLLDTLDAKADFLPVLAGYYFAQSQNPDDVRVVISYLADLTRRDPARNWRWLAHAVYLARHRVGDMTLALSLAHRLAEISGTGIPLWTQQMPAFVLADTGEAEAARDLMEAIMDSQADLPPSEIDFMRRFIENHP